MPLQVFEDNRGEFRELVTTERLDFRQVNLSKSKRDVFRGMHFQAVPHGQGKLVQVISGLIRDFVLDVDPDSESFGNFCEVSLSENDDFALWIPPSYAHGFLSMEDDTIVVYAVDNLWSPEHERVLDVSRTGIVEVLGTTPLVRSERDLNAPSLTQMFG